MTFKRSFFAGPYLVWMVIFILSPMFLILYYTFTQTGGDGSVQLTLHNLARVFDPLYLEVLWRSLWMAALSTVICLLLGYPLAMVLADKRMSRTGIWMVLIMLPMWMNFLLRTYAWMALLENPGPITNFLAMLGFENVRLLNTQGAVLFGMVYNFLPFMILPIYTVLIKIPQSCVEAAQDLGADSMTVFRKVTFPLSLPGVVSGITMVFMPAVSTFVISRLMGGSQFMLYGDLIENQFVSMRDWNFGSALSLIMMILILISMAFFTRSDKQDGGTQLW